MMLGLSEAMVFPLDDATARLHCGGVMMDGVGVSRHHVKRVFRVEPAASPDTRGRMRRGERRRLDKHSELVRGQPSSA